MKAKRVLLLMVLCATIYVQCLAQSTIGRQKVDRYPVTSSGTLTYGLTWLPTDYDSSYASSTKYPLIIFLHGSGEVGDSVAGLNNLITQALPMLIAQGFNPEANNPVDGKHYKFIVVSPQAPTSSHWSYSWSSIQWMLPDIINRYRIDTTRIYVTGLSAGGAGTWSCVTNGIGAAKKFPAVVPVSAAGTNTSSEASQLHFVGGTYGVKVWNICGENDSWIVFAKNATDTINSASPAPTVPAILTSIAGAGHDPSAWNTAYDPNWRSNSQGLNIYEWMLKWNTASDALTANAGTDQSITLPTDSVQLNGNGTGAIANYRWKKISGPPQFNITDSSSAKTTIHNLAQGIYNFELTVADTNGIAARDTVQITVNSHVNMVPIVNAGADTTISLPTDSVSLSGHATDVDGTIINYSWSKVSGPFQYAIAHPDQAQATLNNLTQGVYRFELMATDSEGAVGRDTIQITVNGIAAAACNGVKRYMVPGGDGGKYMNGNPAVTTWYAPINPGDTLVLNARDSWSYFSIAEYSGTAACPIVIQNEGGQVWLTQGIATTSCKYVKITGSGDPNTYYGFRVYNPGQDINGVAVCITGKSRVMEVERVDVYKKTYGVWAKQDPMCDESFNYPNYIMDSIEIHHCKFKNIGQDCIYAGNTDPLGTREYWCDGQYKHFIPMRLSNINIHHLIIDSCNRTGIQLGGANSGYNQIHDNVVTRCGYEYNQYQGTGISIGGMTRNCHVYNNHIRNTFLYGILSFGVGTNYIENNTIDSTGWLDGAPNSISRPSNILASPKETIPFDSTRIIIRNNKMGLNSTTDDTNIGIVVWGPPTWATGNVVCSNTKLDGITAAKVYVDPTVNYISNCSGGLPNIPPSAFAGNDIIVNPVRDTVLKGTASDPDGTIVSYHWTRISGPSQFTIKNPDSISTAITNLVPGVYVFRLTVMDNDSLTASDDIQVNVAPPNMAPIANAGANQIITLPLSAVTMTGSGSDVDGTIVSYQWTKISGPSSLVIVNAVDPLTQITSLAQGSYEFEFTVTDNSGAQDRDTVMIIVNPAPPPGNIAPTANAGSDVIITLPTNFVILNGSGNDPDGSIASYQWTKISGPASYILNNASQTQTGAGNLEEGTYQFELKVTDNVGAIGRDTVTVIVNPLPNKPPLVNAGADQVITLPANSVTLTGAGSDDGYIVNFTWTKISGPSQYNIASISQAQTTVNNLVEGIYQFELMAIDNMGVVGRDTVMITVNPKANVPPLANAGADQIINLPVNTVLVSGNGVDTDGTIVSYQWSKIGGPGPYTIGNPSSSQTYIHNLAQGIYQFVLTVTDDQGATGRDTVMITVNAAANVPPVAHAGNDLAILLPENSTTLVGSGTDTDGFITGYSWTKISGPTQFNIVSPSQPQTNLSDLVQGTYQFELKVTDNQGAIGRDTVTVIVNPATTFSTASLYPNPATTTINIKIQSVTHRNQTSIRIYDVRGVLVYEEEFLRMQTIEIRSVDVSKLLPGAYVVLVGADINNDISLKFIKD
jgi:dienelactone hydrolase